MSTDRRLKNELGYLKEQLDLLMYSAISDDAKELSGCISSDISNIIDYFCSDKDESDEPDTAE
jgi:hypothetical protein